MSTFTCSVHVTRRDPLCLPLAKMFVLLSFCILPHKSTFAENLPELFDKPMAYTPPAVSWFPPDMWHPDDTQQLHPLPILNFEAQPATFPVSIDLKPRCIDQNTHNHKQCYAPLSNNYCCPVAACGQIFPSYISAYYHFCNHRRNADAVECPAKDCNFTSTELETLETHWNVLHDTDYLVYSCKICSFTHEHDDPLLAHLASTHAIDIAPNEPERSAKIAQHTVNCKSWFAGFFYPRRKGTAQRCSQPCRNTSLVRDMHIQEVEVQTRADSRASAMYNATINSVITPEQWLFEALTPGRTILPPPPMPMAFQRRIGVLQGYHPGVGIGASAHQQQMSTGTSIPFESIAGALAYPCKLVYSRSLGRFEGCLHRMRTMSMRTKKLAIH